jgi:hypothetical protein
MGESYRVIYSKAKKCFVCHKPLGDGGFCLCHMGDPLKYERLCTECKENKIREDDLAWEEHLKSLNVKQERRG